MRILQVITDLGNGGAESLVASLSQMMNDNAHFVEVMTFSGLSFPFDEVLRKNHVKVIKIKKGRNFYNPLIIFKLIPYLKRYDVIHTHNYSPQLYLAIAKALSFSKVKLVTTEHSTNNGRRKYGWLKMLDKWMYSKYSVVISVSDKVKELLEERIGKGITDIRTVINGANVYLFHNAKPYENERNKNDVIFTMVARFLPPKDQITVIKALTHLPANFKAWFVGTGNMEKCENLVKGLNLSERVRFWGNRIDVPNILRTSDVVVMSSRYEGMSLSSIEGMSVGKPFVASDVVGLREMTEGYGILFAYQDDKELARLIKGLCDDRKWYESVAAKCYERAQKFDLHNTAQGYMNIYDELYNGKMNIL